MFSAPPYAFPATVHVTGLGPISDALVGMVYYRTWIVDINLYQLILMDVKGMQQAVRTLYMDDPYYPRPEADNLEHSTIQKSGVLTRYLAASKWILGDGETKLSSIFVEMLILKGERRSREKEEAQSNAGFQGIHDGETVFGYVCGLYDSK